MYEWEVGMRLDKSLMVLKAVVVGPWCFDMDAVMDGGVVNQCQ